VLVAGTNGKGSVCSILASILKSAGFTVGLLTSPHLVNFNERISVDGVHITDGELVELTEEIRALVQGSPESPGLSCELAPSFFEFTTALALAYFKEKQVDIAILEVGMGGRLDATNVVTPVLSLITSIGLDHEKSLGDNLASIAAEKGGIIKEDSTVIAGPLDPEACSVIERISSERGSKLLLCGRDFKVEDEGDELFHYVDSRLDMKGLEVALYGAHQRQNAAIAIAALGELSDKGFKCTDEEIRLGLKEVAWPGRCELIRDSPKVILDCAHNVSAAQALSESLALFSFERLILILGIMADKDIEAIFTRLIPLASHVILTSPKVERAESTENLMAKAKEFIEREGLNVKPLAALSVEEATGLALEFASENDLICISGSLFTVGEARDIFEQL
ncbi:MAG: bifunctional folylpolyglutamate synthase/dihydrofolate synthase, partial [Proteobacteria bacterium]|nr:bifunctional folylpolyglutamate synthase/dihydrofolate synthase [Pseudomonadota bacterium]